MTSVKALLNDLERLLNQLCSDFGFCGGARTVDVEWMLLNCPLTSQAFAEGIMRAEGFEPLEYFPGEARKWVPIFRQRFSSYFGECLDPTTEEKEEALAIDRERWKRDLSRSAKTEDTA